MENPPLVIHKGARGDAVPFSADPLSIERAPKRRQVFGTELEAFGGDILLQIGEPFCSGDRNDVRSLRQKPSQCDLGWCRAVARGDWAQLI